MKQIFTWREDPDRSVEPHLEILVDRFRFVSELEEHRQVDVRRGRQHEGVGQADHPVLSPEHEHLGRRAEHRHRRDEAEKM